MTYVERDRRARWARGAVRPGTRSSTVRAIRPAVDRPDGEATTDTFDAVVLATHADDALAPARAMRTRRERSALGGFEYSTQPGRAPHRRAGPAATRRGAWASWNVGQDDCRRPGDALTMTYHMNRLQSLPGPVQYCVSVNPGERLDPARIIVERADAPPACTRSGRSTRRLALGRCRVSGARGTPAPTSATASTRTAAARASRSPRRSRPTLAERAA